MGCPLDTPSCFSDMLSPTLSPPNLGIETESDKASDCGTSNGVITPTAASDITRLRFECRWEDCGKVFRRPSDLTKHERYHIKEYLCDEAGCDKAFATQKDLKRHKMTHGTPDGDSAGFRCRVPGCRKAKTGHVYNRRDNFIRHMRTKHVGMRLDVRGDYDVTY